MTTQTRTMTIYPRDDEYAALRRRAFDDNLPQTEIVRRALRQYLGLPPATEQIVPGKKRGL